MLIFLIRSKSGSLNATYNNPTEFYYGSKDGLLSKLPKKTRNSVGRQRILNKPKLNASSNAEIIPEKEINSCNYIFLFRSSEREVAARVGSHEVVKEL